jgi:tRNA (adenine22-N1)-methyltransferase
MDNVGVSMKLSARLQIVEKYLPQGCLFADIGSDHALLPVSAVMTGRASGAVAGEVNDGPFEAAKRQVASSGLQTQIAVRKGNGLAVVQKGEVQAVTIAGMGGALIATILGEGIDKLEGVQRLILQPNVGEDMVRRWLLEQGWVLTAEEILEEDGKIYEILVADRSEQASSLNEAVYQERQLPGGPLLTREWLLWMGPMLTQEPSDVFFRKWALELDKLSKIRKQMGKSEQETARQKEMELDMQMNQLREVLACLQKDKP